MRSPIILALLIALVTALSARGTAASEEPRFKVIVNPENPNGRVHRDFLRDAYLKKATEWSHGPPLRPVDLARKYPARRRFTETVLRKTPAQLRNYWNQQIFSGKGVPPPEASSPQAVIQYVLKHPGAIGYIPADVDHGGAKVIAVQ